MEVEAGLLGAAAVLFPAVAGDRDQLGRGRGGIAPELRGHLEAVHPGQAEVAEHDLGMELAGGLHAVAAGGGQLHLVAGELQEVAHHRRRVGVVLHDQDAPVLLGQARSGAGSAAAWTSSGAPPRASTPCSSGSFMVSSAPCPSPSLCGLHLAAVHLDEPLDHREPDARARPGRGRGCGRPG